MQAPLLILASRSARRAGLLSDAGYRYRQVSPAFDDPAQPESLEGQTARQLVQHLARQKAQSCLTMLQAPGARQELEPMLLLSADTLCVDHQGDFIGQPQTSREAGRMIESFMGRSHEVITGVALLPVGAAVGVAGLALDESLEPICYADSASVWLDQLDKQTLDRYLASNQWRGKAGGYNLFDRQAAGWPVRVETGDPTTVVGLPMKKLAEHLKQFNIEPSAQKPTIPDRGLGSAS